MAFATYVIAFLATMIEPDVNIRSLRVSRPVDRDRDAGVTSMTPFPDLLALRPVLLCADYLHCATFAQSELLPFRFLLEPRVTRREGEHNFYAGKVFVASDGIWHGLQKNGIPIGIELRVELGTGALLVAPY
jgi:hypothetical protein